MNKRAQRGRRQHGQALVETACGLIVLSLFFLLIVGFGVNAYAAVTYGTKLQIIATETARVLDDERLWLGVVRPDYDEEKAHEKAENMGKKIAEIVGVDPGSVLFTFREESTPDGNLSVVTASVGLARLPFQLGVFPTGIPVSQTSVSARGAITPYAAVDIDVPVVGQTYKDAVRLPAYGFFRREGLGAPFDITATRKTPSTDPKAPALVAGKPAPFAADNFRGFAMHDSDAIVTKGAPAGTFFSVGRANKEAVTF